MPRLRAIARESVGPRWANAARGPVPISRRARGQSGHPQPLLPRSATPQRNRQQQSLRPFHIWFEGSAFFHALVRFIQSPQPRGNPSREVQETLLITACEIASNQIPNSSKKTLGA